VSFVPFEDLVECKLKMIAQRETEQGTPFR
jgi:hypothetical protein